MGALRWLALVAGIVGACGSTDPPPVPLDQFAIEGRAAVCDWAVRCAHAPDLDACRRLLDPKSLDTRRAQDAVAAGRLIYDPVAAATCVEATREAHCLATPWSDPACAAMLTGQIASGQACTSDFECAGGADCEDARCDAQCCVGQCGAPLTGTPPPREAAAIGEACQQHADCELGAYCETDRVCAAMPTAEGQRCVFGCARGDLYCDVEALVCKRYGAAGEACDPAGATAPPCDPAWSHCDEVCVERPGEGQPCDDDRVCIAATFCRDGTCVARGDAGAPCTDDDECAVACDVPLNACVEYATCTIEAG